MRLFLFLLLIAAVRAGVSTSVIPSLPATFYPETYGATTGDTTNDRAAFQSAVDAAYSAGGGIVQCSPGTYYINENGSGIGLLLKTGVTLRGAGKNITYIATDPTLSTVSYNVVAPFNFHTVSNAPYTAHELAVEDITFYSTSIVNNTASNRLHNFIACVNNARSTILRCGFGSTRGHFSEFNNAKNIRVEDCSTELGGFAALAKFQIDNGGNAGPSRATAAKNTSISNSATYASGTQTLLTVTSTTGFNAGDHVLITSANGASPSTYNALGGYRVTGIVSATTVAVALAWPGSATTAGTLTATIPNEHILITRYLDKPPTEGTSEDISVRNFLDLSHTNLTGITRNVAVTNSTIVPYTCTGTIASGQTRYTIGFDSEVPPLEFTGLEIRGNVFRDGGHTGNTIFIALHNMAYNSTYPLRSISGVRVENNVTQDAGMLGFLWAGDQAGSDGTMRTSIAATATQTWRDLTVRNNVIQPILRGGATTYARATRAFMTGAAEAAQFTGNRVFFPNVAPSNLNGLSWTASVSGNYAFCFDHVRNLHVEDNEVEVALTEGNAALYLYPYVFGCAAFELAASGPLRGHYQWINNRAIGTGSVANGIVRGFSEILTAGTTGMSSWASTTAPSISGIWRGNRVTSGGTLAADTCFGAALLNVPRGTLSNTVVTAANCESPDGTNPGRHRWGYGPRTGTATLAGGTITVADTAITANSIINVQRVTAGGSIGDLTITRSVGVSFTVTSASGTDTSALAYTITEPN
jgi:hypothetical protein